MKALGVADEGDLAPLLDYSMVADQILIDAKPPKGADLPGGNGLSFDWRLVAQRRWLRPWMLAGGLTGRERGTGDKADHARQVDVSGVESAPGVKDGREDCAFCRSGDARSGRCADPALDRVDRPAAGQIGQPRLDQLGQNGFVDPVQPLDIQAGLPVRCGPRRARMGPKSAYPGRT